MGIIQNDGYRFAYRAYQSAAFCRGYTIRSDAGESEHQGERVMRHEVANPKSGALANVVQNGTARRLKGILPMKKARC